MSTHEQGWVVRFGLVQSRRWQPEGMVVLSEETEITGHGLSQDTGDILNLSKDFRVEHGT